MSPNENLGPEKNRNFEFGTKWQFFDDRLFTSAALFRTEKTNARIPDPTLPGFNQLAGNQIAEGFELQLQGQLTQEWNVTAGYDYISSNTTKTVNRRTAAAFPLALHAAFQRQPVDELLGHAVVAVRFWWLLCRAPLCADNGPDRKRAGLSGNGRDGQISVQPQVRCAGERLQPDRQILL